MEPIRGRDEAAAVSEVERLGIVRRAGLVPG